MYRGSVLSEIEALKAEGKTDLAAKAEKVANVSTFLWLSSTSAVPSLSSQFCKTVSLRWSLLKYFKQHTLEMLAASRLRPRGHNVSRLLIVIVPYGEANCYSIVFPAVVYNLPERDCSAKASDGEFHVDNAGESRYEAYIKSIYSEIERFPDVPVVLIVEPDSIGNRMSQS